MRPEETKATSKRAQATADAGETIDLIKRYVIQETIGPLRHIGRRLAFGAAGGLLLGTGLVILLLAVLRALQTETGSVFAGNGSFWPYLCTAVVALLVLGGASIAVLPAIRRGGR